eukprot:scaffold1605_cov365-Pavlova_lutheri.AAC.12
MVDSPDTRTRGGRASNPLSLDLLLCLLPCLERASAGMGGANGRARASRWCLLSRWSESMEEAHCALGLASSRRSVPHSKEGPRVYLTASHLRLELGQLGCRGRPCAFSELHLAVPSVRPGANVSWQSHRHRPTPQPYLLEAKVVMGSEPPRALTLVPERYSPSLRRDTRVPYLYGVFGV